MQTTQEPIYNSLHPSAHPHDEHRAEIETSLKTTKGIYWAFTAVFSLFMLLAGFADLMRTDAVVGIMEHLGYPAYLATILGVLKIAGAFAILFPPCVEAKEWAYAGFTFDLLGATVSHLTVGDPLSYWSKPLGLFLLMVVSYGLWKKIMITRSLGLFSFMHRQRL